MYSEVKVGDKFFVSNRVKTVLASVSNVTPKRFEVGGYTFNKKDGSQVGGGSFSSTSIQAATEDMIDDFNLKIKKKKLVAALKEFDFSRLELDQLEEVKELINKFHIKS